MTKIDRNVKEPNNKDLNWLVEKRNEIQKTAFNLWKLLEKSGSKKQINQSLIKQDLVGVTFSLWRGVFLAYDKKSPKGVPPEHAKQFLKKIIATNAINFSDDKALNEWTANYYVDNAGRVLADFPKATIIDGNTERCGLLKPKWELKAYVRCTSIKKRWEYNYKILSGKITSFEKQLFP